MISVVASCGTKPTAAVTSCGSAETIPVSTVLTTGRRFPAKAVAEVIRFVTAPSRVAAAERG